MVARAHPFQQVTAGELTREPDPDPAAGNRGLGQPGRHQIVKWPVEMGQWHIDRDPGDRQFGGHRGSGGGAAPGAPGLARRAAAGSPGTRAARLRRGNRGTRLQHRHLLTAPRRSNPRTLGRRSIGRRSIGRCTPGRRDASRSGHLPCPNRPGYRRTVGQGGRQRTGAPNPSSRSTSWPGNRFTASRSKSLNVTRPGNRHPASRVRSLSAGWPGNLPWRNRPRYRRTASRRGSRDMGQPGSRRVPSRPGNHTADQPGNRRGTRRISSGRHQAAGHSMSCYHVSPPCPVPVPSHAPVLPDRSLRPARRDGTTRRGGLPGPPHGTCRPLPIWPQCPESPPSHFRADAAGGLRAV